MDASYIDEQTRQYIQQNSGLDQHRDYLGISKIAECPRKAYWEFFNGMPDPTEEAHRMCYAGYEQERGILEMLAGAGVARILPEDEKEVAAPFDTRLRGHVDGVTVSGDLLEVKSVSTKKFEGIKASGLAMTKHYIQVQLYMLYGKWDRAFIHYRCRETYEHITLQILFNPEQALKYQQKAARLLQAIDRKDEPPCKCGRCL